MSERSNTLPQLVRQGLRVLMFGWELPPLSAGGLGNACLGLVKALRRQGVDVVFVVPREVQASGYDFAKVLDTLDVAHDNATNKYVGNISLHPYTSGQGLDLYGSDTVAEVTRFAEMAIQIGRQEDFDIVHAHDWLTYGAGKSVRQALGKPLVAHVHSTEQDRALNNPNPWVCAIEREGLVVADLIIAVSRYTKQKIVENYGVSPGKVEVIHNGIDEPVAPSASISSSERRKKIVLFVGRLTAQKGPQYFVLAAKRVLELDPTVIFLVVGDGDMRASLEETTEELGIRERVLFPGFLSGPDLERAYALASVCVMTSVSEPFGLVALEAMQRRVPVIVSRHAGVTEIVRHCLKVDFWDVDLIADRILTLLGDQSLAAELSEKAAREVRELSWDRAARNLVSAYKALR